MKVYKCDLCGKEVDEKAKLIILLGEYQTNTVHQVCRNCAEELNSYLSKIREKHNNIIAEEMRDKITITKYNIINQEV